MEHDVEVRLFGGVTVVRDGVAVPGASTIQRDRDTARDEIANAHAVVTRLDWTPWAAATGRLLTALDDPDKSAELPLGLGAPRP